MNPRFFTYAGLAITFIGSALLFWKSFREPVYIGNWCISDVGFAAMEPKAFERDMPLDDRILSAWQQRAASARRLDLWGFGCITVGTVLQFLHVT